MSAAMPSSKIGRTIQMARYPPSPLLRSRSTLMARQEATVAWSANETARGGLIEVELAGTLGHSFNPPQTDPSDERVQSCRPEGKRELPGYAVQRRTTEAAGPQRIHGVAGRDGVGERVQPVRQARARDQEAGQQVDRQLQKVRQQVATAREDEQPGEGEPRRQRGDQQGS